MSKSNISGNAVKGARCGFFVWGTTWVRDMERIVEIRDSYRAKGFETFRLNHLQQTGHYRVDDLVVVVCRRVDRQLIDELKALRRKCRIVLHCLSFKLQWLAPLGAGRWEWVEAHAAEWLPQSLQDWVLPFDGKTWLYDTEVKKYQLSDRVVQKGFGGKKFQVSLKGLHVQELPVEYVDWLLGQDWVRDDTREILALAADQPYTLVAYEHKLAGRREEEGFGVELDAIEQDATDFHNPNFDQVETWVNFGTQKRPTMVPLPPYEEYERRWDWTVLRNGATINDQKEFGDEAGLEIWGWRKLQEAVRHIEGSQDLDDLRNRVLALLAPESRSDVSFDEEGNIAADCDASELRWNLKLQKFVDPTTKEEWLGVDEDHLELVLETYEHQRTWLLERETARARARRGRRVHTKAVEDETVVV